MVCFNLKFYVSVFIAESHKIPQSVSETTIAKQTKNKKKQQHTNKQTKIHVSIINMIC